MTDERLNELEAIANAATPGNYTLGLIDTPDERLIVAACNSLRPLIAALREARAERDAFMALDASYREQINEAALRTNQAFQRGVAAMRREGTKTLLERNDALLRNVRGTMEACVSNVVALELMNAFRQLPDPEDK